MMATSPETAANSPIEPAMLTAPSVWFVVAATARSPATTADVPDNRAVLPYRREHTRCRRPPHDQPPTAR